MYKLLTCATKSYYPYPIATTLFGIMCNLVVFDWKYPLFKHLEMHDWGQDPQEIICFWLFYFKCRLIRQRSRVTAKKENPEVFFAVWKKLRRKEVYNFVLILVIVKCYVPHFTAV